MFPTHYRGFLARVVYRRGEYLGCLDRYGNFIADGDAQPNWKRVFVRDWLLFWSQQASMLLFSVVLLWAGIGRLMFQQKGKPP
jgi:hypothetical protein